MHFNKSMEIDSNRRHGLEDFTDEFTSFITTLLITVSGLMERRRLQSIKLYSF